jgi:hypothetical protein
MEQDFNGFWRIAVQPLKAAPNGDKRQDMPENIRTGCSYLWNTKYASSCIAGTSEILALSGTIDET